MRTEFHIQGMHSEAHAAEIVEKLETTAGVRHVEAHFNGRTIIADFDERTVQRETLLKKL